jgi:chorismate synthase
MGHKRTFRQQGRMSRIPGFYAIKIGKGRDSGTMTAIGFRDEIVQGDAYNRHNATNGDVRGIEL